MLIYYHHSVVDFSAHVGLKLNKLMKLAFTIRNVKNNNKKPYRIPIIPLSYKETLQRHIRGFFDISLM